MYKNIKKIRYQRKQKRLQILYTHRNRKKTTTIVVLCSSIKKIEMLKENSYLFTNKINKKRQIMFN